MPAYKHHRQSSEVCRIADSENVKTNTVANTKCHEKHIHTIKVENCCGYGCKEEMNIRTFLARFWEDLKIWYCNWCSRVPVGNSYNPCNQAVFFWTLATGGVKWIVRRVELVGLGLLVRLGHAAILFTDNCSTSIASPHPPLYHIVSRWPASCRPRPHCDTEYCIAGPFDWIKTQVPLPASASGLPAYFFHPHDVYSIEVPRTLC